MKLTPIPTLDELALEPNKAAGLSADAVESLLAKCTLLQSALVNRLLALRCNKNESGGPQGETQTDGDFLKAEQAAPMLGVTPRWLYRNAKKLPFAKRLSRKVLRFSESGLRKWRDAKKA